MSFYTFYTFLFLKALCQAIKITLNSLDKETKF